MRILVLNGPNLNLLGVREPNQYGNDTLETINERMLALSSELGDDLTFFQSNHEGDLINAIHDSIENKMDFIIFNPAAFTHTSETFRHHSYFSDIAKGVISGFGAHGYEMALIAAHHEFATDKDDN